MSEFWVKMGYKTPTHPEERQDLNFGLRVGLLCGGVTVEKRRQAKETVA